MIDYKIKFIIVSKDDKFSLTGENISDLYKINKDFGDSVRFQKIANNKENLTIVYNRELRHERENKSNDFLVFLHADVVVDFSHMIKHIIECKDKYDIMGLCGCQKIITSQSPLNWFTGSMQIPQSRFGCVTHGELGNHKSFFSGDRQKITDAPVACIDGLCIIFGRKTLESNIEFDERLRFNCYDTQISFDALMNFNLKLGVIVEESLMHYSVGKSILSKDFLFDEIILRNRFKLEIPKDSPIQSILNKENTNN